MRILCIKLEINQGWQSTVNDPPEDGF